MTPEQEIAKKVYDKAVETGEIIRDMRGFYRRPYPSGIGLPDGVYREYDRYIQKVQQGACPLCDTLIGHAPRCDVMIAIEKSKEINKKS